MIHPLEGAGLTRTSTSTFSAIQLASRLISVQLFCSSFPSLCPVAILLDYNLPFFWSWTGGYTARHCPLWFTLVLLRLICIHKLPRFVQKYTQNQHKVRTEGSVCICMSMWRTVLISLQASFVLELILNDPSTRGSLSQIDLCFYICSHPTCIQFHPLLVLWAMLLTTASMVSSGTARFGLYP